MTGLTGGATPATQRAGAEAPRGPENRSGGSADPKGPACRSDNALRAPKQGNGYDGPAGERPLHATTELRPRPWEGRRPGHPKCAYDVGKYSSTSPTLCVAPMARTRGTGVALRAFALQTVLQSLPKRHLRVTGLRDSARLCNGARPRGRYRRGATGNARSYE